MECVGSLLYLGPIQSETNAVVFYYWPASLLPELWTSGGR